MLSILALLLSGAQAQDCDAKQLSKDLHEASPVAVPRVFLKLAECDPSAALEEAEFAMGKTLHGDEGNQAALQALKVGAQKPVMDWVDALEPDHRSQTMLWFGDQCGDVPEVGEFFVASAEQKTEPFLMERWYRGMAKCRVEGVQGLLKEIVEGDKFELNAESKFGFIEVYARNLGKDAIGHLKSTAGGLAEPKDIRLVINAFGDAANVGSVEGIDEEAAAAALGALKELAATTHPEAIEQMRDTMLALGAEDASNEIVMYRWSDRKKGDTYEYGVVATEDVTCKNGKKQVVFHHGKLTDISKWPDALEMDVEHIAKTKWELQAAEKCKGTGEIKVKMTSEPLADDAAWEEWLKPHRKGFEAAAKDAWKSDEVEQDTTAF